MDSGLLAAKDVAEFIALFNGIYSGKLKKYYNYSRVVQLAWLHQCLVKHKLTLFDNVAVVSGSNNEPELKLFTYNNLDVLNYSDDKKYDLDIEWDAVNSLYDLTICNQVFEHVFNPDQAFKNLASITKSDGYIFISVPAINCVHGEPYFYSSGYHPRFLTRLANQDLFRIVDAGQWGSIKYMLHTVLGYWPTYNTLGRGYHKTADLRLPHLMLVDGRNQNDLLSKALFNSQEIITDCWILLKKI